MLMGIPSVLSPDLLKTMMEMGHSEKIILSDGNFPAQSTGAKIIRLDGHGIPEILDAILKFFPLDYAVQTPVTLMEVTPGVDYDPVIWKEYKEILQKYGYGEDRIAYAKRFDFYSLAKESYAVVTTGEKARFANILLQKGVVTD